MCFNHGLSAWGVIKLAAKLRPSHEEPEACRSNKGMRFAATHLGSLQWWEHIRSVPQNVSDLPSVRLWPAPLKKPNQTKKPLPLIKNSSHYTSDLKFLSKAKKTEYFFSLSLQLTWNMSFWPVLNAVLHLLVSNCNLLFPFGWAWDSQTQHGRLPEEPGHGCKQLHDRCKKFMLFTRGGGVFPSRCLS